MKASKDFSDGHLWYSVISRPPSSTFTRVQRVSCCFSLLLCTMLTSIMFYGIPSDPSEQTMDLGIALIHYILFGQKFGPFIELNSFSSLIPSLRFAWWIKSDCCYFFVFLSISFFPAFYRRFWVYLATVHDRSSEFTHHVSDQYPHC